MQDYCAGCAADVDADCGYRTDYPYAIYRDNGRYARNLSRSLHPQKGDTPFGDNLHQEGWIHEVRPLLGDGLRADRIRKREVRLRASYQRTGVYGTHRTEKKNEARRISQDRTREWVSISPCINIHLIRLHYLQKRL